MIPLPPNDEGLPAMRMAMDRDAMAAVFDNAFPGMRVSGCDPYYVKYKPGGYARVQYRIATANGGDRALACAGIYSSARADRLAARHGLERDGSARAGVAYVERLHGIAQLFPADLGLPGLGAAMRPVAMTARFRRELSDRIGGNAIVLAADLVRYKAAKRAVIRYRLDGAAAASVFGKVRKDGAGALYGASQCLARAGVATPETLAWLPEIGLVVQSEGAGERLADLRDTAAYVRWMPAVAGTLARLHDRAVEGLPHHSAAADAQDVRNAARTIRALAPGAGEVADSVSARVASMLVAMGDEVTATHGSFHDDQVLVGDAGVTLIDADAAALGNPLSDVGHFLSYLSAAGAGDAYEKFLDAYLSARPQRDRGYLVYEAASLLRWATLPFREMRPDWPAAMQDRVRLAAHRLHEYEGLLAPHHARRPRPGAREKGPPQRGNCSAIFGRSGRPSY